MNDGIKYARVYETRVRSLPWQDAGLTYTATGYGNKIPTQYQVLLTTGPKVWRRVYAVCYSHAASFWVAVAGKRRFVRDYELQSTLKAGAR